MKHNHKRISAAALNEYRNRQKRYNIAKGAAMIAAAAVGLPAGLAIFVAFVFRDTMVFGLYGSVGGVAYMDWVIWLGCVLGTMAAAAYAAHKVQAYFMAGYVKTPSAYTK